MTSSPMRTRVERIRDDIDLVTVAGEVDLATADDLLDTLRALGTTEHLIIDVTDVSFFGSSGISTLVQAREQAHHDGRYLYLVAGAAVGSAVVDTLRLTGLLELFDIHRSTDDLVRELSHADRA